MDPIIMKKKEFKKQYLKQFDRKFKPSEEIPEDLVKSADIISAYTKKIIGVVRDLVHDLGLDKLFD